MFATVSMGDVNSLSLLGINVITFPNAVINLNTVIGRGLVTCYVTIFISKKQYFFGIWYFKSSSF